MAEIRWASGSLWHFHSLRPKGNCLRLEDSAKAGQGQQGVWEAGGLPETSGEGWGERVWGHLEVGVAKQRGNERWALLFPSGSMKGYGSTNELSCGYSLPPYHCGCRVEARVGWGWGTFGGPFWVLIPGSFLFFLSLTSNQSLSMVDFIVRSLHFTLSPARAWPRSPSSLLTGLTTSSLSPSNFPSTL